jgi:glycosyltransferase involved in cell wall biosynthesis
MKILCISTTKNECDVMESFIRHNARFCDHFCLIDESKDATRDILQKLKEEGFSIGIFNPNSSDYQQAGLINACLDAVRQSSRFDWAVFLDADEILSDVTRAEFETSLAQVPATMCATVAWQTYVPLSLDYFLHEDPLVTNFRPRSAEHSQFLKVMVPEPLFAEVRVSAGNHAAYLRANGQPCPTAALPVRLAHFPVRSMEQISLKNILACHTLTMKRNRQPGEGNHVHQILNDLRQANFEPRYELLRGLALKYADMAVPGEVHVNTAAPALRAQSLPIRYREMARPNVISILDREIEYLARKILKYRESNHAAIEALTTSEGAIAAATSQ